MMKQKKQMNKKMTDTIILLYNCFHFLKFNENES